MRDFLIVECSNNVVDAIDVSDVTEEVVAQALALGGASHDSCDINNLKHGGHFGLGMEHIAQLLESLVGDGDDCLVGLDGAEGIVLCGDVEVGEHVVGGRFADVGQSDNAHP